MIGKDLESRLDLMGKKIIVNELIARYLKTKTGVKHSTLANYNFVQNIMKKEEFGSRKITEIKTSDAKFYVNYINESRKLTKDTFNSLTYHRMSIYRLFS